MDILQSLAPPVSTGELPLTVSGTGSGMALVMANLQWHGGMVGCSVDDWSGGSVQLGNWWKTFSKLPQFV